MLIILKDSLYDTCFLNIIINFPNQFSIMLVLCMSNEKVVEVFIKKHIPEIQGLILGGGKSTRMDGIDKIFIKYHGASQYVYLEKLMQSFCEAVFVSCNQDQAPLFSNAIPDSFLDLGPYGGLLSAFRKNPNVAWFSIACDMPLLNEEMLKKLISKRNPSKIATCFYNPGTASPEPLITIWEPRAYSILLHYLSLGYSSIQKVLLKNKIEIEVVKLDEEEVLFNANTPEERDEVMKILSRITLIKE